MTNLMRTAPNLAILLILVTSAIFHAPPATAAAGSMDTDPTVLPGFPTATFATGEELVRDAYRRYEILAARADEEVEFNLSNFTLITPNEYNRHLMTDIRTFGGGWTLRAVSRTVVDGSQPDQEITRLEPYWTHQPSWLENAFPHVVGKSIATIFANTSDWEAPVAILTYRVEVSFEGRHRSYQAAFYFNSFDPLKFTIQDHISQGMAYVYEDLRRRRLTSSRRRHPPHRRPEAG